MSNVVSPRTLMIIQMATMTVCSAQRVVTNTRVPADGTRSRNTHATCASVVESPHRRGLGGLL
jgi:hypothetical protein